MKVSVFEIALCLGVAIRFTEGSPTTLPGDPHPSEVTSKTTILDKTLQHTVPPDSQPSVVGFSVHEIENAKTTHPSVRPIVTTHQSTSKKTSPTALNGTPTTHLADPRELYTVHLDDRKDPVRPPLEFRPSNGEAFTVRLVPSAVSPPNKMKQMLGDSPIELPEDRRILPPTSATTTPVPSTASAPAATAPPPVKPSGTMVPLPPATQDTTTGKEEKKEPAKSTSQPATPGTPATEPSPAARATSPPARATSPPIIAPPANPQPTLNPSHPPPPTDPKPTEKPNKSSAAALQTSILLVVLSLLMNSSHL